MAKTEKGHGNAVYGSQGKRLFSFENGILLRFFFFHTIERQVVFRLTLLSIITYRSIIRNRFSFCHVTTAMQFQC